MPSKPLRSGRPSLCTAAPVKPAKMTAPALAHENVVVVSGTLEAKESIKCAAEYRPLANEYNSTVCSDWAERRQCLKTGGYKLPELHAS